jgi:adenine-specific DNA-methyltransferase
MEENRLSKLTALIDQLKAKDPLLGSDLDREFKALSSRLSFGLNFERHSPEAVELPLRPIRRGDKVRVLPARGSTTGKRDLRLWIVKRTHKETKQATLELANTDAPEELLASLDDLIVVAEFRDTIYPGLVSTGKFSRGGDKPWHTVINGENYHALKALTFTHRGKVDAIYIDPPYNTGAKDWKYNNDYVEGDDLYRHSKWLAMIERRLIVARELLDPSCSALIVTIDEKEYLRLGLLLEQTFPDADIQMISSVIFPSGSSRAGRFSRSDEYIYFVFVGSAAVAHGKTDMLRDPDESDLQHVRWNGLIRNGEGSLRSRIPSLFYPVFIDAVNGALHSVGTPLASTMKREDVVAPKGTIPIFPVDGSGRELMWRLHPPTLRLYLEKGYAKLGKRDPKTGLRSPQYLQKGTVAKLEAGLINILGRDEEGALILKYKDGAKTYAPLTSWNRVSHSAAEHGSSILKSLIPGRKFPYPKSLYAVEDCLKFIVRDKKDAIILDFFSGSGTTAHAVMRMNHQDGGARQCISITNNEVAADEQKKLREENFRPGDPDWEKWGICDYITKPRVAAAITGITPTGEPIKGEYKFTDEFPMSEGFEENAEFFTLTYETPISVSHNRAFERISPLLWMRAGSNGTRIDKLPSAGWAVAETYGILIQLDHATPFLKAVVKATAIRVAYIVTDDERRFQALAQRLPREIEAVRLYESYLTNFAFANGSEK